MANCSGNCSGSVTEILTEKLNIERATFVRLTQVVQAFEVSNGAPQSDQGALAALVVSNCATSELGLLTALLEQKAINFNQLGLVILAV